ncbi:genetic suppressor element 1-like isoform 1-T1 [Synchiropus picturatus]
MFGLKSPRFYLPGMNHESNKSPPIGMITTATRTTATVSPISPLTNGNTVQSGNSGFAAALRKLAKQAEDPRGSAVSSESSPVSSPATSHSSPVSTPKRVSLGPILAHSRGHSVPSTPPVVTIAPTKTSNGLWRAGQSQTDRDHSQQDKRTPPIPSPHTLAHSFGLSPSAVMQDPRIQSLSLPGQMHPVVPSGAIPEEYLRALRPFATSDDLRLTSVPLSLDPAAAAHAAAAAAYYHPAYLHHPLSLPRMEESLCLSALRSQFYSVPAGGSFPPIHPSALHLHLPGSRYPGELNHTALAERLQMENELRQREQEREREKEREAGLEREREREREEERERELDRQKERQRERQQQMVRAAESHYLAELQARRAPLEDRPRPGERLTPSRLDKAKDLEHSGFQPHKTLAVKPGLHPPRGSVPHPMPSLVPSHLGKHHAVAGSGFHGALAAAMMTKRAGEEQWLAPQRGQGQEMESLGGESRRESHSRTSLAHQNSGSKDATPRIGAPPPLISPKTPHQPAPPTTLWNPASLLDTPTESRRKMTPPIRPPPGLTRTDRTPLSWGEKLEEGGRRRADSSEKCPPLIGGSLVEASARIKAEHDRGFPHLYQQHFFNLTQKSPPVRETKAADSMLVFDDVLQQHRRLVSKLDLEEKRRKEAREGGYYYDLNDSYDESDEEEVKAHLRRVTEQPPLKLDTTSEKMEFLRLCGLGTLAQRDDLLERKKRKRRRMMRERSPSPQEKKKVSRPTPAARLTTPFTADEMDNTPELEAKKDFLQMFSLSHVSPQQRRGKERTEELLKAIQKKTVTLDTLRYNSAPLCRTPPAAITSNGDSPAPPSSEHQGCDSHSPSPPLKPKLLHHNGSFNQSSCKPPPLSSHHEKALNKKMVQNGLAHVQKKEPSSVLNGRSRPWERFTPEAFAQHFHQAVLHSTHHTLEHKGVSPSTTDIKSEDSGSRTVSPPKPHQVPLSPHLNGHHSPRTSRNPAAPQEQLSEDEDEEESGPEEEEEEDEVEAPQRKWSGIEAVFHAYQEHMDEWSIERQVLHSQCKRLESQNLNLTRTAEQLSLTMGELVSQRQKMREERERLQAQLEHFRRCLTLPSIHWGRGQVSQHTPR